MIIIKVKEREMKIGNQCLLFDSLRLILFNWFNAELSVILIDPYKSVEYSRWWRRCRSESIRACPD